MPQQGKRISQKVGLGLSRAEKRREGKGKAKNPSHPALSSKGGQEAAPGSEEARRPAYRKTTPRLQGQNQEQTETIKGSDSKVKLPSLILMRYHKNAELIGTNNSLAYKLSNKYMFQHFQYSDCFRFFCSYLVITCG